MRNAGFGEVGLSFLHLYNATIQVQHREGHRRVHKEGVRQEVQPDLALHRGSKLWFLRHVSWDAKSIRPYLSVICILGMRRSTSSTFTWDRFEIIQF